MSSQQAEKSYEAKNGELSHSNDKDSIPSTSTLTILDRYTALRNHRIRFQDALDINAERVASLRKHDIILGRGKNMQDYPGNRRMRSIIKTYKHEYQSIQRSEKRDIVEAAYKEIVLGGARFLTKAPNEKHFVLVDIEVALQKVSNTLRCRKNWNKVVAKLEGGIEDSFCASKESKRSSAVSGNRFESVTANPPTTATSNPNQAIGRNVSPFEVPPPPVMLGNRSQTMSLLRENTVRLMKQMPLLPATLNDLRYLQYCHSLQRYYPRPILLPFTAMREQQQLMVNVGVNASFPEMDRLTPGSAVRECPETSDKTSWQRPNGKVRETG